ncbi:MAG: class I SAM-dependent methyltransferase [Candidatus Limnocylindrales bacterium]
MTACHARVVIDIGTGDGHVVLRRAAAEPTTLAIGLDAVAGAVADASRRAARPATRGGLPNALFVVAAAEALPAELQGVADEVTLLFPWGSLLRGLLGPDAGLGAALVGLLRPGGCLTLVVSLIERDGPAGQIASATSLVRDISSAFERAGLRLGEARPLDAAGVRAIGSSWGRRLRAGGPERPAWRLQFERPREAEAG